MTREEELEIIGRVQQGDANAFELLVLEYEKNVFNLALRMMKNREDAMDAAQDAFLKAYNSIDNFRGDSKFSVWLYRIVSNVCLDALRIRSRRAENSLSVEDDEGDETQLDIPDEDLSPQTLLERKLSIEAVRRGLDSLPRDHRQILLLREIQGLSYEEIGQILDLEPGTVKSRIFRARKKLCAFLIRDGNIPDSYSSGKMKGGDAG